MFRAYEPERDRLVALKVFRLNLEPERVHLLAAALDELVAAGLAHPGISVPLAAGLDGVNAYLAQDYVSADSLDVVVRDHGPSPATQVVRVASQVAGALDHAAAARVDHGALHPRDILVSPDEVRLTGLGVARALERVGAAVPVRRPYTAPERIAEDAWDSRADVFGLAAMMHEMLSGRRIAGTGAAAVSAFDLPGRDSTALRAVFARALAPDRNDRFVTASDFAEALRQVLTDAEAVPTRERPMSVVSRRANGRQAAVVRRRTGAELMVPLDESDTGARETIVKELTPALDLQPVPTADTSEANPPIELPPPPSSSAWPLGLAVIIGLAIGFAGGYAVGIFRGRGVETAVAEQSALPPAPALARDLALQPDSKANSRSVPTQPEAKVDASAVPRPDGGLQAGRLLIRSTPSGARILIDGRDHGRTPATVRSLDPGTYRIRVTMDGYVAQERRAVITESRPSQSITFDLARARGVSQGALRVESRPAGAQVFLDGRAIGTTPLELPEVAAGEHTVRIERSGYRQWSSAVVVTAGGRSRLTASLER